MTIELTPSEVSALIHEVNAALARLNEYFPIPEGTHYYNILQKQDTLRDVLEKLRS